MGCPLKCFYFRDGEVAQERIVSGDLMPFSGHLGHYIYMITNIHA